MIKVMFWNINRRTGFENIISDVVNNEQIDILLLAEAMNVDDNLIKNSTTLVRKSSPVAGDQIELTPRFYSTNRGFTLDHYHTVQNTKRLVLCFLDSPNIPLILLGGIHFPSKLEYDNQTQHDIANSYINWLTAVEDEEKRTILFGDFNMNPFELGMIGVKAFNATLSKQIALAGTRTFQRDEYNYFYNPMWNFMGDINFINGNGKIPGSYYLYTTGDTNATFWNVFDKVICRPEAEQFLDYTTIRLLMSSGIHQFANVNPQGLYTIDNNNFSDHLPLVFNLIN